MRSGWPLETAALISLLSVALIAGIAFGGLPWFLLLAVSAYLGWHLWNLRRLDYWLRRDRSRNPPESAGIWSDLFEHYYRLQQRHHRRKQRLRQIIGEFQASTAAMPDGSMVLDPAWRIVWFNQAAERMLDLKGRTDLGQLVTNLIRSPHFSEHINGEDFSHPVDIKSPADPGRTLSLMLVPYGEGQHLLLIRDVTRLKRLEAMRRDFVANASHELRSPLTVLNGYLEEIQSDTQLQAEWGRPLQEMQRQCRRMTALVNDLLELTRMETEEGAAARDQTVDVCGLAAYIVREARAMDDSRREITLECDPAVRVLGAENELYSAFSNLVFNAIRYTEEGGHITVRWCGDRDRRMIFEVVDDGIGIDEKHIPFLTQRFYRVDESRSRRRGGTGLGLAIVKHVMQRHGARLEVESELGHGSTFRCAFPDDRVAPVTTAGLVTDTSK